MVRVQRGFIVGSAIALASACSLAGLDGYTSGDGLGGSVGGTGPTGGQAPGGGGMASSTSTSSTSTSTTSTTSTSTTSTTTTTTLLVPLIVFSDTLGGPATTVLSTSQWMYGRLENLSATNTECCVEIVGKSDGTCAGSAWTKLPNAEWSFDAAAQMWRSTWAPYSVPVGQYRNFCRNTDTNVAAIPVVFAFLPTCQWTATVPGPVPPPTSPCSVSSAGAQEMSGGYLWTCECK